MPIATLKSNTGISRFVKRFSRKLPGIMRKDSQKQLQVGDTNRPSIVRRGSRKQIQQDTIGKTAQLSTSGERSVDRALLLPMRQLSQSSIDCVFENSNSDLSTSDARFGLAVEYDQPIHAPMRQLSKRISNRLLEISRRSGSNSDLSSATKSHYHTDTDQSVVRQFNQSLSSLFEDGIDCSFRTVGIDDSYRSVDIDSSFRSFGIDDSFRSVTAGQKRLETIVD